MQIQIDITITAPEIADAISQIKITSETQKSGEEMKEANKSEATPTDKIKTQPQDQPHHPSTISLETLRTKLIDLSRNGKQPQIKALINSFGVNKLTDIPESKYEEMLAEVEKW